MVCFTVLSCELQASHHIYLFASRRLDLKASERREKKREREKELRAKVVAVVVLSCCFCYRFDFRFLFLFQSAKYFTDVVLVIAVFVVFVVVVREKWTKMGAGSS